MDPWGKPTHLTPQDPDTRVSCKVEEARLDANVFLESLSPNSSIVAHVNVPVLKGTIPRLCRIYSDSL